MLLTADEVLIPAAHKSHMEALELWITYSHPLIMMINACSNPGD